MTTRERKKTRITNVEDLPKWFDLRKYESLRDATSVGWFFQFAVRADAVRFSVGWRTDPALRATLWKQEAGEQPKNFPWIIRYSDLIAEHPFLTMEQLSNLSSLEAATFTLSFREIDTISPSSSTAVHPVSIEELYLNEGILRRSVRRRARHFFRVSSSLGPPKDGEDLASKKIAEAKIDWFTARKDRYVDSVLALPQRHHPILPGEGAYEPSFAEPLYTYQDLSYPKNSSIISVDLSLPDSLLVEEFKSCLESMRKIYEVEATTRFTRPDFDAWMSQGVLPYLDLRLWALLNEVRISNSVFAEALYADGLRDEAAVRRTTAKTAKEMITPWSHDYLILKVQAARHRDETLKTTDLFLAGMSDAEIYQTLSERLRDELSVGSTAERGSREKTITLLLKTWVRVPAPLRTLRDEGIHLLQGIRRSVEAPNALGHDNGRLSVLASSCRCNWPSVPAPGDCGSSASSEAREGVVW